MQCWWRERQAHVIISWILEATLQGTPAQTGSCRAVFQNKLAPLNRPAEYLSAWLPGTFKVDSFKQIESAKWTASKTTKKVPWKVWNRRHFQIKSAKLSAWKTAKKVPWKIRNYGHLQQTCNTYNICYKLCWLAAIHAILLQVMPDIANYGTLLRLARLLQFTHFAGHF